MAITLTLGIDTTCKVLTYGNKNCRMSILAYTTTNEDLISTLQSGSTSNINIANTEALAGTVLYVNPYFYSYNKTAVSSTDLPTYSYITVRNLANDESIDSQPDGFYVSTLEYTATNTLTKPASFDYQPIFYYKKGDSIYSRTETPTYTISNDSTVMVHFTVFGVIIDTSGNLLAIIPLSVISEPYNNGTYFSENSYQFNGVYTTVRIISSSDTFSVGTVKPIRYFPSIALPSATYDTAKLVKAIYENEEPIDDDNPYIGDEGSGTGGGDGDGTPSDNDSQPDDGIPSISITDTGLISLYTPSLSELQSFGNYLWSDAFSLDTFKKLFSDPMDAILGMSIVPLNLSGSSSSLIIGNVDTGLSASKLSQQYYTIDCGSFTVQPDINSYLDYSPYTRFSVFLPYIGFQTLDADDIMGQTLNIKYKVDVLTTALVCEIRIDDRLRYSFSGTCGTSVPITAQNWGSMIQSVVSSATALAGLAVGAAAAPVTGGASLGMSAVGAAGSIAGNSLSMKPDIQKGGSLGGSPGFMGWQTPFLIRYTPRRVNSKSQQTYTGYPSLITSKLSDVHGYTEIQSINLSVSGATDSECIEIDRQLKQGVILP